MPPVKVSWVNVGGRTLRLLKFTANDLTYETTVGEFKQMLIKKAEQATKDKQYELIFLKFHGRELIDDKLKIRDLMPLFCSRRPRFALRTRRIWQTKSDIAICTLTGKTIPCSISISVSVLQLKKWIYSTEKIPPEQQRLIYAAKTLEDKKRLQDYGVSDGSVIHLILRLRGGGGGGGGPENDLYTSVRFGSFVDVTKTPTTKQFDEKAPYWRRAFYGLNLEGKCKNRKCRAGGMPVLVAMGNDLSIDVGYSDSV
jgi:hypothetical protein